jgi:hypothetical protein
VVQAAAIISSFLKEKHRPFTISEKEIAVTFLAEGGALLMSERVDSINRIDPVYGIGLDNLRQGFAQYPELVAQFDARVGTRLRWILVGAGKNSCGS